MDEPDAGLWEFRNVTQVHTYTLLFHWAGSKAVAKLGRNVGDKELVDKAERLAKIASDKIETCYDPVRKSLHAGCRCRVSRCEYPEVDHNGLPRSKLRKAKLHLKALEGLLKEPGG
ncbi:MAG: hypothetical protein WDO15_08725 [Bacteroidota bacterium]